MLLRIIVRRGGKMICKQLRLLQTLTPLTLHFEFRKRLFCRLWWAVGDSNTRLPACKAGALTKTGSSPKRLPYAVCFLLLLKLSRGAIDTSSRDGNHASVTAVTGTKVTCRGCALLCILSAEAAPRAPKALPSCHPAPARYSPARRCAPRNNGSCSLYPGRA